MANTAHRRLSAFLALIIALVWLPLLAGAATAADPVLVPDLTVNGCNGVLPTPGSANTTKRLDPTYPSDFDPGGVIGYVIDFPVGAADVGGDFEITDCVYVDPPGAATATAIAKYFVHFVPNNTSFQLRFAVPIPADTPLGSQFCNYAKTTASPSASQASNRKAGPACFTVGGGLRVEKRSGSANGPLLGGASFSVVCTPVTSNPPTIITGLSNQSQPGAGGTVTASGTATDGTIAINGPSGTPCVVTETAAPPGYLVDATPRALVIPVGTSQTVNVFVNQQLGSLSVSKQAVGEGGTFTFAVSCDDGETYAPFQLAVAAGATVTHLVSDDVVVGTQCTVSETVNALFSTVRTPLNGTVTVDADGETVAFTNTRRTGSLVVQKASNADGTFAFDVDCDGTTWDTTLTITTVNGAGSDRIDGIPTTTVCTVTEQANPLFSSVVSPVGGAVTIVTGDNAVAFTNTRLTGRLLVTKASDVDGTFTFDVDCTDDAYDASNLSVTTVNGTGSASVTGIPTGVVCTVTEDAAQGFTTVVVPADGTVTIATGDNPVAFTNTRVRGDLLLTKASDVDGTFTFDVDCTDDAYDASNVSVTTVNGVGSATVEDIPTGVVCTVTEDAAQGFTSVVVPADGTVTIATGSNPVAFTNTRVRGDLLLTKVSDMDGTFTFDVDCTDDAYDATGVVIATVNATGSHTIEGIPSGVLCTVTERADPLWTSSVIPANGTVTIDDDGETVAFTNVRRRGSLTVTKTIVDGSNSGPHAFGFVLTCDGAPSGAFTLGDVGGLTRTIEGIPTGTVCSVAEDAVDSWLTTVTPENGTVTIDDDGETVAFLNTKQYTAMTHSKASDPASGTPVTDGDTITYTLAYANAGNAPATVSITDAVPAGTTLVPGSAAGAVLSGSTLTWALEVPAGGEGTVSFSVTVDAGLTDPFTIRNVSLLHEGEKVTPSNETEHPVAHLSIAKAVDKAEAAYGEDITYTLTVTNPGAADLTNVVVTDPLPAGAAFVSASDGGTLENGVVTWPARDLASGATYEVTFVVRYPRPAGGIDGAVPGAVVLNSAAVDSAQTPSSPSNRVRTIITAVLGVKIIEKPPTLPTTGAPLTEAVSVALAMLLAGAGLTFGARWHAGLLRED